MGLGRNYMGNKHTAKNKKSYPGVQAALNADAMGRLPALLKAKEVALALSISENTVRQWIWQRRLPVIKLGRAVRLRREDLMAFIERHRRDALND
jgi:excisionase family DNA binding protein